MNVSWIQPVDILGHELNLLEEQGANVAEFRRRWTVVASGSASPEFLRVSAGRLLEELTGLSASVADDPREPSLLEEIMRVADPPLELKSAGTFAPADLQNRIRGGWLGRAAGCLLGKPVEKIARPVIRKLLESNGTWPLSDYVTAKGIPEDLLRAHPWNRHSGKESLRENIVCMTEDDDMNYPMLNLSVLEAAGMDFTTEQVAAAWLGMLPVLSTFTAERVTYLNCVLGLAPPATAMHRNPYREWIGAQIRGDVFGWVCPGSPRAAAELSYRDARLSHVRNGIYGELFVAGMSAAACVVHDPREAVNAGLRCIPPHSRLAEAVRFAISLHDAEPVWESAVDKLYERYGGYHWVHSINNAALVAAAILYGGGDFSRSICNVVMGGWDTDSNGATVGSVVGTVLGAERLPACWVAPLNNRIRSSLKGFDNSAIDHLARRTFDLAYAHLQRQ